MLCLYQPKISRFWKIYFESLQASKVPEKKEEQLFLQFPEINKKTLQH